MLGILYVICYTAMIVVLILSNLDKETFYTNMYLIIHFFNRLLTEAERDDEYISRLYSLLRRGIFLLPLHQNRPQLTLQNFLFLMHNFLTQARCDHNYQYTPEHITFLWENRRIS
jgi:hypothetical protein